MRVVVLGSTGLLGRATTDALLRRGDEVVAVSRSGQEAPGSGPAPMARRVDVVLASGTDLDALLHGSDAVVHALGPDDRERPPAPATTFFRTRLAAPTARVAAAAARQGVPRMVVLGSYYSTFHRRHPEWRLTERHAYISAREEQARSAIAAGGDSTEVSVLEIPFVFGALPGIVPMWKSVFFDALRRGPVAPSLPGGSAAVTHTDIAAATVALASGAVPAGRHPIATDNITFGRLTRTVLDELGRRAAVVTIPRAGLAAGLRTEKLRLRMRRKESGLDPNHLPDLLCRNLFLDTGATQDLFGLPPTDVGPTVRDTVRAAYPDLPQSARHAEPPR